MTEVLIGFEISVADPECWANFKNDAYKNGVYTSVLISRLERYSATITTLPSNNVRSATGFLEFETEADMIYFKMEWS